MLYVNAPVSLHFSLIDFLFIVVQLLLLEMELFDFVSILKLDFVKSFQIEVLAVNICNSK